MGVPGDRQVDMKRLEASFSPAEIEEATAEDLQGHPELVKGYIGPGALGPQGRAAGNKDAVRYLIDPHVVRGSAWVTGADSEGKHVQDLVYGRDFEADGTVEAVEVRHGDMSPDGSGPLSFERGVEIGQVFQLGLKYSKAMGLNVLNRDGKAAPVWMGCYGIGVSRVMSCIAELHHDDKGLIWPRSVAPAQVHIVATGKDDKAFAVADSLTKKLEEADIEVLYDDRPKVSPGVKFKDSELLGIPLIVVAGRDTADNGTVEIRHRATGEKAVVPAEDALGAISDILADA